MGTIPIYWTTIIPYTNIMDDLGSPTSNKAKKRRPNQFNGSQ